MNQQQQQQQQVLLQQMLQAGYPMQVPMGAAVLNPGDGSKSLEQLLAEHNQLAHTNRLLQENLRLTIENQMLAMGTCAPAGATMALKSVAFPVGQVGMPAVGFPSGFLGAAVQPQAATVAMAALQQQQQPQQPTGMAAAASASEQKAQDAVAHRGRKISNVSDVSDGAASMPPPKDGNPEQTTVMMRNVPNNYTRDMLINLLDKEGFRGLYNFLYLPMDFNSGACLGYAFVNLVNVEAVPGFWRRFHGFSRWSVPSRKVCHVTWSGPHQGYQAHVERYRNSPVMHPSVPEEYRPVVFLNGERVSFPLPARAPRVPRVRRSSNAHD